jgi:hypothetical protein
MEVCFMSQPDKSDGLVAHWSFDEDQEDRAFDSASGRTDAIEGLHKHVVGAVGSALRFDGLTTGVRREAASAPRLGQEFAFEAWVAVQAYPWGLCAIIGQCELGDVRIASESGDITPEEDPKAGYYFAIDARGRVHLQAFVDGQWQRCASQEQVPLMQWTHIAGSYDADSGLKVYINGQEAGMTEVRGDVTYCPETDLLIGRNDKARPPENPVWINIPAQYSFDGFIDEVRIYNRCRSSQEIGDACNGTKPSHDTGMTPRRLPREPAGPAPFGAHYCRMRFCDTWDAPRREGPLCDVVVRFDAMPWRYVFWRGTNYIPHWVTENGIWYTNEFNETWKHGALGCAEPMSDKQSRHSHVRIVEQSDARVVLHWRYALIDTRYVFARVDRHTGWGDWSDEYHTIYPDGVGVRKIHLWSSQPLDPHEFQESIVLVPPGKRPEDILETEALTMVNMAGETHTYSWAEDFPNAIDQPQNANIEYINTKSEARPFLVVSDKAPQFTPYNFETHILREHSIFPWWNHWPVAQIPSDGRWATEPDRVAHSSLTTGLEWEDYEVTENTRVRIMLHGLTEKAPVELVPLAKSWLRAPELRLATDGWASHGYDQAERAYRICRIGEGQDPSLSFEINGSEDNPLLNPAFIVEGWGEKEAKLSIDGRPLGRGPDFRQGHRMTLDGTDLIVWVRLESTRPVRMAFSA